ncbi:lysozyme inhibitor LprI family protein [Neisseria shayeganii]|uniref:DUF1311 domain-containing protein n=1 Tax=Neisseria shayeganii TaxID=607712 RepID=A0A7D7ND61_9NEIS|nr:lysozyme inhibitor LprI family protein [Neisseria shayeganii]QMT41476.1 DUF1311 domain-containing protein [Neisseria shayeganii]
MKRLLLCTLLSAACLSACGEKDAPSALSCSAPEVVEALKQQIRQESAVQAALGNHADQLPSVSDAAAVNSGLEALGLAIDDIRTVQPAGKDNAALACEASLRLTPTADAALKLQESFTRYMSVHETDGIDMESVMSNGLRADGKQGYFRSLSYTVQATDDGAKTVVELDSKAAAAALSLPLRFYLAHAQLKHDAQVLEQAASAEAARQQELDALNQAQLQARLEAAKSENQGWHRQLNQQWQSLPPAARAALKTDQEQWNRLRESECAYFGKSESSEPLEQEVLRLECDSQRIEQRLPELAQNAETHLLAAVNEARRQNQQADQEIRRLWQSIPDDVKAIIGQDYQNWNSATSAKCAAAAQQAGSNHSAQLARLQCETEETRSKINELRGYVVQ